MRASDKKNNMKKANILAESLYRQRNNEDFDYAAAEREFHDRQDYEDSLGQQQMGGDDKMYDFISKYVKDPDDIEMELNNFHSMGYQGLSDYVKANLDRDMDFISYVQMTHDDDTFRRETNNEDYDYAGEERAYHDKQGYESSIDNKFSNKNSILNALYKILKNENIEGRYTDEHWAGISKLTDAFKKYNIDYDLVDAKYEHKNDYKTQLPNSKVYTYMINVMDKNGKQHELPLRVTCAFVGRTGTMADEIYELTYYFAV
jgi:hypothetical protein